ncbi:T9SS type A sorting domain-containing protein [Polaribacter sp.]|uniref:T9SS type A sorting domain-containing protein n=1 Tax=Polaribacter sp. TaxID=1920175 RepID=UPI003EF61D45
MSYFDCSYNALTSLSTISNEELGVLRCNNNVLTSLDINGNVNLTQLYCGDNNLTSLDYLYNAPYLNFLSIENNQIATLDISANQELLNLFVDGNGLSSLDVTNNSKLTVISANNNQLQSLDVSNNPDLFYLYLSINQLSELDVSNNPDVSRLLVRSNLLTNLDLRNGNNTKISNGTFNTINNPNLSCIYVDNVAWSATNWTNIDDTSHFVADEAECTTLSVANYEFNGLKIISNPTSEYIKLSIEEEANFVLIDLNGKILRKGKLTVGNNAIPVSSISKGLCLLKITNTRNSSFKKIIIQ